MSSPRLLVQTIAFALVHAAMAQCGPVIGTFPYQEGFEAAEQWTHGGTGDDWEWGTPAHPLINTAGEGVKSWCVGGLSGQFYTNGEKSWLMSPCFDFSTLSDPWISFLIFWEVERTYDGMVLQYSLDQGNTWDNVGAYGDPVTCLDQHWYNTNNIINLDQANPKHGWSGRQGATNGGCQGGQGSGEWVTASHCMSNLAGEPSVRFRFLFGAGTTCNNFDGIAIDDVYIGAPPQPDLETSYTCDGQTVSFSAVAPCATSIVWDLGDPGSGASNTGNGLAVTHDFADPGNYTISVTLTPACGQNITQTFEVTILGVEITTTDATCGQPNGSLQAVVTGSNGPFTYDWQPGNGAGATFSGLAPGDYSLNVSGTDMCGATANATVQNSGSTLAFDVTHTNASCSGTADGSATVDVTAGSAAAFAWVPAGGNGSTASGLAAGDYTVTVTSDEGCDVSATVTITEPDALVVTIDPEIGLCPGSSVTLAPEVTGGTGSYTLTWSPAGPDVSPITTTVYDVTATDANGCVSNTASTTVDVSAAITPVLSVNEPAGCVSHCVQFTPGPVGMSTYAFDYGDGANGTDAAHCYVRPGIFNVSLTVTDDIGCAGSATFTGLVEALPRPQAGFAAPATILVTENPLRLVDVSSGGTLWHWELDGADGDDTLADPLVTFPSVDCYTLRQIVTNDVGCSDTATADVCMENEFALYAPNAFTPNGDGFNEVFGVISSVRSPVFFELRVFDRWGGELFTTSDPYEGWTGKNAEEGVYAWKVELRDSEHKLRKASGHVVLLR